MLLILVILYYCTSTSLSFVYSFLLSKSHGLKYPILFSAVQNLWQVFLSFLMEKAKNKFSGSKIININEIDKNIPEVNANLPIKVENNHASALIEIQLNKTDTVESDYSDSQQEEINSEIDLNEKQEQENLFHNQIAQQISRTNSSIFFTSLQNEIKTKINLRSNPAELIIFYEKHEIRKSNQLIFIKKEKQQKKTKLMEILETKTLYYVKTAIYLLPCTFSGVLDILLSTVSLQNVSLALYTMIKSSSPIFILLSSFLINNEPVSFRSFFIIVIIGLGTFFLTYKKCNSYDSYSLLILLATLISGIRWSLIQRYLKEQNNTFQFIRQVNLNISFNLLVYSLIFEIRNDLIRNLFIVNAKNRHLNLHGQISSFCNNLISLIKYGITKHYNIITITLSISFFSFMLVLIEFAILKRYSSVFLSILGIFKELTIILISVYLTDTIKLSLLNWIGLSVSLMGLLMYALFKGSE